MMPLISSEEHNASEASTNSAAASVIHPHFPSEKPDATVEATSVSSSTKNSLLKHLPSSDKPERKATGMDSKGKMMRTGLESALETSQIWLSAEEPATQLGTAPEDSLKWLQALDLQVVGACRTDERLQLLLRWNVLCFGSDGKLLAHLDQLFKARELALLARSLCTPVVSLRVGKVTRYGRYLYPTSARGYLNLMLLPCSEMRLSFADDVGMVERVAITSPGMENGGILIQELKEDASKRTFLSKDRSGRYQYFWQSEKLNTTGDELISKIKSMLKRRPTLTHLTGIEEGKLESFVSYLRTTNLSQASNPSSQTPTVPRLPSLGNGEKPSKSVSNTLLPLRKSFLKFSTLKEFSGRTDVGNHTHLSQAMTSAWSMIPEDSAPHSRKRDPSILFQHLQSSIDNLRRFMNGTDKSECSPGPDGSSSKSRHPGTAKLIESLKRLQNSLRSLNDRRSEISLSLGETLPSSSRVQEYQLRHTDSPPDSNGVGRILTKFITKPLITNVHAATPFACRKYLPVLFSSPIPTQIPLETRHGLSKPCPSNRAQGPSSTTVVHRDLGPALDLTRRLQAQSVHYCPSETKFFDLNCPCLIPPTDSDAPSQLFAQLVSQIPLTISHLSNETPGTHNLYVLPFVLKHEGASSLHLSILSRVRDHLRRVKYLHLQAYSGYSVPSLSKTLPMFSTLNQRIIRWRSGGPHPMTKNVVVHPSAKLRGPGYKTTGLEQTSLEICHDKGTSSSGRCKRCYRCEPGSGLGNLVLINYYAQQTGHGLRVVIAEITSGNISYIVSF
ncbi:uncharacterized protein [Physcomitrium patens]|uniref:uncharacterized protein isoform X2 n=1 Tax=Physcomitrium patens TaxID=3218 RepID=UPI003CCD96E4